MSTAIYTALVGNYDKFIEPLYHNINCDYHLFTDANIKSKIYTVHKIKRDGIEAVKQARQIKILPHIFLPEYEFTVWHDANITQSRSLLNLMRRDIPDFRIMSHIRRDCVYEEFAACSRGKKDDVKRMLAQMLRYNESGLPRKSGMVSSGIMLRKNNKIVNDFCNKWWAEVKKGSCRDQLSFNYVAYNHELKIDIVNYYELIGYFIRNRHL